MYEKFKIINTQGTKWELQKINETFAGAVKKLSGKVFGGKRESFLIHQLKKLLSTEARKETRKHLSDHAAVCYSDFSKGCFLSCCFWFLQFILINL